MRARIAGGVLVDHFLSGACPGACMTKILSCSNAASNECGLAKRAPKACFLFACTSTCLFCFWRPCVPSDKHQLGVWQEGAMLAYTACSVLVAVVPVASLLLLCLWRPCCCCACGVQWLWLLCLWHPGVWSCGIGIPGKKEALISYAKQTHRRVCTLWHGRCAHHASAGACGAGAAGQAGAAGARVGRGGRGHRTTRPPGTASGSRSAILDGCSCDCWAQQRFACRAAVCNGR